MFHLGPRKHNNATTKSSHSNHPHHHVPQIYYREHLDLLYQNLLGEFPTSEYKAQQQTVKMTKNTIRVSLPCIHDIYHKSYICKDYHPWMTHLTHLTSSVIKRESERESFTDAHSLPQVKRKHKIVYIKIFII